MGDKPELAYQLDGNPQNPTILYLHGFLGCKNDWNGITKPVDSEVDPGRTAHLLVDLPGHGSSLSLDDDSYRMEECARHIVKLLDSLHIDNCSVIGYSMGGRLALYLAVHHPEWFDRFVIESGSPGLQTKSERAERIASDERLVDSLINDDFGSFLTDWYNQPLFASVDKSSDRFQRMMEHRGECDTRGLVRSLQRMGTGVQPSLWGDLKNVDSPILFVAGEQDAKFRLLAEEMADLCPNGQVAIIDGAGHNTHFDRPAEFAEQAAKFLTRRN
ncbi:MAG: 2-succinyl-6-hydroxy-2,4-cyclohexadiene-1-carboxylate synthase [Candidatus Zixiibacteriota bacterium]|nr:MAG: 2-succinyl-6-hydroxy-2,4-cyclohexadiene-1-carboxylate synthase [candidate division Zixibacteria bacterium]